MKKITMLAALMLFAAGTDAQAGLINRTNYVDGFTISAAAQNQNENTIVGEINGLLDADNIEDGTLTNAELASNAVISWTKLEAPIQSSQTFQFNMVGYLVNYVRPSLAYVDRVTVDISSNTGTSGESCIMFPDRRICVTEHTGSTSVSRRAILTESASLSGTKNSGLRSGYVLTNNTFYSVYSVKATDAEAFVVVVDTISPVITNFATLNSAFGTNGWVYLGSVIYGNNADNVNSLCNFIQMGAFTVITSTINAPITMSGTSTEVALGVLLSSNSAANILNYTYTAGFKLPSIPASIAVGGYSVAISTSADFAEIATQQTGSPRLWNYQEPPSGTDGFPRLLYLPNSNLTAGLSLSKSNAGKNAFYLRDYYDSALKSPFANPF